MISSRKPISNYNGMLLAYEDSCLAITKNYCYDMDKFTEDSVRALCSLFQSYLHQKKNLQDGCQSTFGKSTDDSSQNSIVGFSQNLNKEIVGSVASQIASKKVAMGKIGNHNVIVSDKPLQAKTQKEYLLMEDEESEEDSPTKRNSPPKEFKNKDIAEIIMQSQRKIKEKFENQKTDGKPNFFQEEQSEYGLSDFSNHDGSDEFDEEPHYLEDEATVANVPLFGGLFSKAQSSESNNSTKMMSFNYTSKQLLKSPKKVPKQKRAYIGSKKIPEWAEDMQKVNSVAASQDKSAYADIFGKIVVEHLDTNVIFRGEKENILRTSSAKWNNMFLI